ncbi:hypothetical protein ACXZ66_12460 [Corynebacterium sp. S7]
MDTLRFQTTTAPRLASLVPRWPPPHTNNPLELSAASVAFDTATGVWHEHIKRDSSRASEHAREVVAFLREAQALDESWELP